ncbi:MAG: family 20 glycosylhydrolase [Candidatus Dormibacteria bacterium]
MTQTISAAGIGRRVADIIPAPRDLRAGDGAFAWPSGATVALDVAQRLDEVAGGLLISGLAARDLPDPVPADPGARATLVIGRRECNGALHAVGQLPGFLGDEGYWLRVDDSGVVLMGETEAGVLYGVQTLLTLLGDGDDARLPHVEIIDRPALRLRGLMQDTGRGMTPTVTTLKRNVDLLASLKMNAYFIYLEDGFHFSSHPDIGAHRDRLTADDVREVVAYASTRHVRIIPIIETLGHMEGILGVESLRHLREGDDETGRRVLNPMHPDSLALVDDMIGDIVACFEDPIVGVGGDETFGLGEGRSRESGLSAGELFAGHFRRVRDLVARRGRTMMVWTDQFERDFFAPFSLPSVAADNVATLPRDLVLCSWHYGEMEDFSFAADLDRLGIPLLYWGMVSDSAIFPPLDSAARNAASYFPFAHRHASIGGAVSQWHVGPDTHTFFENDWAVIPFFGEQLWTAEPRTWEQFLPAVLRHLFGSAGERLLTGYRLLATAGDAFSFAAPALRSRAHAVFFDSEAARELDVASLAGIRDLRDRLDEAAAEADSAIARCTRNLELLAFFRFALRWTRVLTDVVEHRHNAAMGGAVDGGAVADSVASLATEYARLYLAVNKPVGLDANLQAFGRVEAALRGDR